MSYQIQVSRQAARQIRTAADWWSQNRPKAPEAFTEEIEKGFDLARSFPTAGEPVAHPRRTGVRRIHLGRIHYHLYYQVSTDAQTVEVLALWHTSRGSMPAL